MDLQSLLEGPAAAPPLGVTPNFVNPTNTTIKNQVIFTLCLAISVLAVGMRMWTKTRLVCKLVLEDWICCLALAMFVAYYAVYMVALKYGLGVHQWNVRLKTFSKLLYLFRIGATLYSFVYFFIKLAILLQYLRVFVPLKKRNAIFWTCHSLIWTNLIFYIVITFVQLFSCAPINKFWKPWLPGRCLDSHDVYVSSGVINMISDFSILILPQHLIWKLQMSIKRKIGISLIFLAGLFACASSALRLHATVRLFHTTDIAYYGDIMALWTGVEIAAGLLAVCLPVSPQFFRHFANFHLWSRLVNSSLGSFFHLKTEATWRPGGTRSGTDEQKVSTKYPNKKYNVLPNESVLLTETKDSRTSEHISGSGDGRMMESSSSPAVDDNRVV